MIYYPLTLKQWGFVIGSVFVYLAAIFLFISYTNEQIIPSNPEDYSKYNQHVTCIFNGQNVEYFNVRLYTGEDGSYIHTETEIVARYSPKVPCEARLVSHD